MQGDFPRQVFELLQQQLASTGRVGATRWLQTPSVGTIAAVAGQQSGPAPIRFPERGIVLAMYGQVQEASAANYASMAMRVQVGGQEDLFLDGQGGPAFLPFLGLFGGVSNWQPVMRRVIPGVDWVFTFQNVVGTATLTPSCQLSFIADADVEKLSKR